MPRALVTLKAAAAQLRASTLAHPVDALSDIHAAIDAAAARGAELLVLPECAYPAYCLGSAEAYRAAAVLDNATLLAELCAQAKRHALHLVCGFVEDRGDTLTNAAVVIDHRGRVLGIHRKTFLWGDDNEYFAPGAEVAPIKTRWGPLGMIICADARAPETAAALAAQGARLICVPTCWVNVAKTPGAFYNPQPDFLIEARAREFTLPFVCANKFGLEKPDLGYCGQSLIVDAAGQTLARAPDNDVALLVADVTLHAPTVRKVSADVRDRLRSAAPPIIPDATQLETITVSAVPGSCLLPLADDATGHDLLETLAAAGTQVVATSLPAADTAERFADYAEALGLRLVGYPLRERVVADAFGCYACLRGTDIAGYAAARAYALDGAAVVFVTDAAEDLPTLRTRAAENRVYLIATAESWAAIIAPDGAVSAQCAAGHPEPVTAAIDLRLAANKVVFPKTDIWVQRRVQTCRAAFGRSRATVRRTARQTEST